MWESMRWKALRGYYGEEQVFQIVIRTMVEFNMAEFTAAQALMIFHKEDKSVTYTVSVRKHTKIFKDSRTFTASETLYNIHNEELINMIRVLLVSAASFARGS